MTAPAHDVILKLEDVSKVYFGTVAVKRANFEVRRGAVNVLVGENGAGKSTLMKVVSGVYPVGTYEGQFFYKGEECRFHSVRGLSRWDLQARRHPSRARNDSRPRSGHSHERLGSNGKT